MHVGGEKGGGEEVERGKRRGRRRTRTRALKSEIEERGEGKMERQRKRERQRRRDEEKAAKVWTRRGKEGGGIVYVVEKGKSGG